MAVVGANWTPGSVGRVSVSVMLNVSSTGSSINASSVMGMLVH